MYTYVIITYYYTCIYMITLYKYMQICVSIIHVNMHIHVIIRRLYRNVPMQVRAGCYSEAACSLQPIHSAIDCTYEASGYE